MTDSLKCTNIYFRLRILFTEMLNFLDVLSFNTKSINKAVSRYRTTMDIYSSVDSSVLVREYQPCGELPTSSPCTKQSVQVIVPPILVYQTVPTILASQKFNDLAFSQLTLIFITWNSFKNITSIFHSLYFFLCSLLCSENFTMNGLIVMIMN